MGRHRRRIDREPLCLQEGEWSLHYTLVRSARRQQRLSLLVGPSGAVELRAPWHAARSDVEAMLRRYRPWIEARQAEAAQRPQRHPPTYQSGCELPYLGGNVRLDVQSGPRRRCFLAGSNLIVQLRTPQPERVEAAVGQWYRQRAEAVFAERLAHWSQQISWVEQTPPLRLRRMRARWGSCSRQGEVCLNTHLIKAAPECIDAVIVHELCHLLEFQHSRRFYALMDSLLPAWRQYSDKLDADAPRLLVG